MTRFARLAPLALQARLLHKPEEPIHVRYPRLVVAANPRPLSRSPSLQLDSPHARQKQAQELSRVLLLMPLESHVNGRTVAHKLRQHRTAKLQPRGPQRTHCTPRSWTIITTFPPFAMHRMRMEPESHGGHTEQHLDDTTHITHVSRIHQTLQSKLPNMTPSRTHVATGQVRQAVDRKLRGGHRRLTTPSSLARIADAEQALSTKRRRPPCLTLRLRIFRILPGLLQHVTPISVSSARSHQRRLLPTQAMHLAHLLLLGQGLLITQTPQGLTPLSNRALARGTLVDSMHVQQSDYAEVVRQAEFRAVLELPALSNKVRRPKQRTAEEHSVESLPRPRRVLVLGQVPVCLRAPGKSMAQGLLQRKAIAQRLHLLIADIHIPKHNERPLSLRYRLHHRLDLLLSPRRAVTSRCQVHGDYNKGLCTCTDDRHDSVHLLPDLY